MNGNRCVGSDMSDAVICDSKGAANLLANVLKKVECC